MRLNKWIAANSHYSRRKADELIAAGRITINGKTAGMGVQVTDNDVVAIDQKPVQPSFNTKTVTLMLNKPIGYVCSRKGQGAPTVYSLIPVQYHHLDIVGRLDKDSAGLLLLTNDGDLHQRLTHPSYEKEKVYRVLLSGPLSAEHEAHIKKGVELSDGKSALGLQPLDASRKYWEVRMHEGRNRQIRRTFATLLYGVESLTRFEFGEYKLGTLSSGKFLLIP
jgi:23S rRNA pseudouridine2605 synthase